MFVRATALQVDEVQKSQLESMARAGNTPQKTARKCEVILLASQGLSNYSIAQRTGLSRPTIRAARVAFTERGTEGIRQSKKTQALTPGTHTGSGAEDSGHNFEDATGQRDALERPSNCPKVVYVAHDGTARLAALRHPAQRVEKFKISKDPNFEDKVGRRWPVSYLDPPDRALGTLLRKEPDPGVGPNRSSSAPAAGIAGTPDADYKRHGTTTLFAAFNILNGKVIGSCLRRHCGKEFTQFLDQLEQQIPPELDLHLILDNYSTHKSATVQRWLKPMKRRRFHFHFIPISSS